MEDSFKIIVSIEGADKAKADVKGVKDELGDSNSKGLTKAVFKAGVALEIFRKALQPVGAGLRLAKDLVNDSVQEFSDFEQGALGIARTMDITKKEALDLSKALYQIETPTAIEELQDITRIAGSMGVAKDGALDFVKAVDRINVALGDEFLGGAEQITSELGKIANSFGLVDKNGKITAQGITDIGNVINELGKTGIATGPFISDFTRRLGGIAPAVGISLPQVAGLGAALEELGQSPEVAGTAIQNLLVTMGKDLPKFASIAGFSVKDFSKLFKDDANQALIEFAKGLSNTQGGFEGLAKELDGLGIDGQRATSVLGAIANNSDLVAERQRVAAQAIAENKSIYDEFNLNLGSIEHTQAQLTKGAEELKLAIGQGLAPIFQTFSNNILLPLFTFIQERVIPGIQNFTAEVRDRFAPQIKGLKMQFSLLIGTVKEAVNANGPALESFKAMATDGIKYLFNQARLVFNILIKIGQWMRDNPDKVKKIADTIRGLAQAFIFVAEKGQKLVSMLIKIVSWLTKVSQGQGVLGAIINPVGAISGALKKMHDGGEVPGRKGQEVPIMAQAGEVVLPIKTVDAIKQGKVYENNRNVSQTINITNNNVANNGFDVLNAFNMLNIKL